MFYGWRNAWEIVSAFLLAWGAAALIPLFGQPGSISMLLVGLAVTFSVIALCVVVCHTRDLLFGQSRTVRGPTADEQRLRGAFRRHSHPDAPGRSRPRAPGPRAGAVLTAV